ncbi:MAG: isocitrate lyase/phosphoenolpyruvate mutase family protein, partial [Gammaproteobacteria bacterium]|nr:isocitrate lyase/phosphoenolpyruvate mutase family protein [Gammaproteobacteria bacterium]
MSTDKAIRFHQLHQDGNCFIMANAWDAGSAVLLAQAGFEAIGTTSAGIA